MTVDEGRNPERDSGTKPDQQPEEKPNQPADEQPGAHIGRDATPAASDDEARPRRAQEISQPAPDEQDLPPDQPDEGWQEWPEGHRQGRSADDDLLRRKG